MARGMFGSGSNIGMPRSVEWPPCSNAWPPMADLMSEWLALREPADAAARSTEVTQAIVDALPREGPLRALDLATGTGSNIRFLASRLPAPQEWTAVDRDPVLLAHVHADAPANV